MNVARLISTQAVYHHVIPAKAGISVSAGAAFDIKQRFPLSRE
jgi:hypothetical protein